MNARFIIFLVFIISASALFSQETAVAEKNYCVSDIDYKLYQEINKYRESRGLSKITLSKSLCYTAYLHAFDLYHNWTESSDCNMHSWSGKVGGAIFCYPKDQDERRRKNVWNKAREITGFPGVAYELVYKDDLLQSDVLIALDMWSSTVAGRNYLLNEDKWKDKEWLSIGVAVYNNYVSVLLSAVKDPKGVPSLCSKIRSVVDETAKQTVNSDVVASPQQIGRQVPGLFYIIGTSTDDLKYAEKMLKSFISSGYTGAKIIQSGAKYRVVMVECNTLEQASKEQARCSQTVKDCWILK